jgi:hypothetical protein
MNQPHVPSSETRTLIVETLSKHDAWVANKLAQAQELCANVKEAMTKLAVLLMEVLRERIAAQESWVTGLAREYQSKMAPELKLAAWEAISELHSDSMRFDVLISAAADAKAVVEDGENPHERVKQGPR